MEKALIKLTKRPNKTYIPVNLSDHRSITTMKLLVLSVWVGIFSFFVATATIYSLPISAVALYGVILLGLFLVNFFLFSLFVYKPPLPVPDSVSLEPDGLLDQDRRDFLKRAGIISLGALAAYFFRAKSASALSFGASGNISDPVGLKPLGSTQTTGSITLTNVDTWYQVPASNLANRSLLILQNRSGFDMYWSFENSISSESGGLEFPEGTTLQLDAGENTNLYVRCSTPAQDCWYAESTINE